MNIIVIKLYKNFIAISGKVHISYFNEKNNIFFCNLNIKI